MDLKDLETEMGVDPSTPVANETVNFKLLNEKNLYKNSIEFYENNLERRFRSNELNQIKLYCQYESTLVEHV